MAEIRHRFAVDPAGTPSLGVVTFNAQQRTLIESMLRDTGDERIVDALDASTDGLFVKNLENVQGTSATPSCSRRPSARTTRACCR